MLPLGYKSLAEHEMKVLYRAWEGQLFVQNRRVCNIVLRSPSQASIPAQLPAKLEFKYIVRISELRKKLPEAAFEKNSYSNNEVCCQQLSFRLYQVEILDESERKDQLIGSMKEKNLALVKYLNDRGILLFLTSSVLAKETDAEANDLGCLQALFLFPSPEPKLLRATDWKREEGRSEAPQQLPLILPLLQQALAGAAKNPNPSQFSPSALVKLHMEEFANVDQCSVLSCDNTASLPLPSKLSSETPKGAPVDNTRSPSSFSNLAVYLSDPESYTLEVSSASACLKGRCRLSDGCTGLNLDPSRSDRADEAGETGKAPFEGPSRAAASKSSPAGERSLQWTKRKSSRILGASSKKKWSPLKMYCVLESSKKKTKEKEKSKKKKKKKKKKLPKEAMTLNIPLAKDPGSPADPKKPTLKLKNILNPLRRKRGAEVLSAEFIHGPRSVSLEGATGSSAGPATEEKKPRLNMATKLKDVDKMDARGPTPRKNIRGVPSEKQRTEAASVERDVAAPDANQTPSGGEECDSHALNLLADLALSSCNSPLDGNSRRDFGRFRPSREHRLHRGKFLHKSSDHEYHRATKKRKGAFLPGQSSRSSLWPAKETGRDKDWPLTAKDRSAVNLVKKKKARANLARTSLALPSEPGDLSDSSVIISLEHSYASPVSEMPRKATPRSPNSRNGVKQDKPGPLVGKVLPFQHQQNSCQVGKPVTNHLPPARSVALATRLRVDFSNSRQVTSRDKTVQVTFQWEAEYLFDLDSKYTNNSLEKTIIRAVHGPWDESLSDDMEEMKLILHMWLALFYSKPVQALTVRKVVEHSNPAKYVSLNSLVDPLEPMDDGGGPYGLEKCPASSLPVAVRIPAEGGEDGSVSPSEKLLPGNRLSSADSLEDESPLTKLEETKDLPQKEELPHPPLKSVDEVVEAEPKEQTSLHPVLPIENPPGVDERVNPPICQTKTDRSQETMSVETSPNDASVPTGPPVVGSRNQQPIASTEVALSVTNRGTDVGSSSEEVKKDNLPTGGPNPRMWKEAELKADVNSRKPTNPVNEVGNQPRLCTDERDGEGVDLGSIDLVLSKSNDADMEIQDMDLVSEDEGEPAESSVKGREEIDGMSDVSSSGQGPLSSRASSPDASSGHPTEFPGVQEAAVGPSSSSVSPNQMGLMDMVPQQATSIHPVAVDEKMVGSTSSSISPNQRELVDTVPQQKASFQLVTVDEKMVGSTSSSISPNQMELLDTVPQQKASFHPVTVDEKMVGSASNSVSPNQMELLDTVPQQKASFHPVTVDEKMVGSAMDPTSPKQTDEVENSHDEAVLANSVSTEASGDFSNDLATQDGPFYQSPQEPVESPRVPKQVDVVDLSSVSQEDGRIYSSCLPSWQASPVHRVSDEEPSRIQEDHPENPLYHIFQNPMGLIEDISQDSTDLADPAVLHLCEPNNNFCVNSVPNSISTRQESVENQDSSVAFAQHLPLTKEMDLVESPEGDHPASPVHQETSDEAATLQDNSDVKLDLLEDSSISQEKDVIHPTENVLGPVNEQRSAESDLGTQEEQKINQGEKIPVDSQPAKEYPSSESHDAESEASFKSETCLDLENIRDSSAREEEEDASPDDGVEKPTISTTAVAEEVHVLMNELVDTVCATIAQSEEMRALKCLDWIDSAMLECVTPPGSDDEGCPTDQDSHADVKWAEECLEESSSFDEQEEDLQARVEGRGELGSSSNENATSDPGDASEKAELQGNDATSAAMETFSSCGTSQAELDTASPKSRCSWLETTESPDDNSAKVDDYGVSTLEKVGQTEASPEEPNCDREDCPRGEDVGNTSFVPAKCQEDSLAEEPGSLVDRDSKEAPEDCEEEAQEEAKGCLGSLEDPLPDERTQMSTSSSGTDTDWEDEYLTVDDGQDPCVDWYPTRTFESWYQPRFKASPSIESELTRSSGPGNETCKDGDWVSSEASQKTSDAGSLKRNVPFGLKKDCLWSRDMDHKPEPFKDYINFSITKKHKEKSRTFHTFSKEHNPFSRDLGSINSWNRNWDFLSDPIQNILDMESLQFHCRIQELLKRSQRSTSRVLPSKKVPCQRIAEGLPSRTVSEETIAKFPTRSKSPLLVTVVNPNLRTGHRYSDIYGPFPASLDPFVPRSQGGLSPKYPFPSLRLQKLTYHKLNSFSRDISSVLEDFAEFSRAMTSESVRMGNPGRDLTATSGKAGEIRYPPQPPTPLVYEDLLAELRNALHFQLKNVAQEASRKPFSFYLMETEDDPFFGRVKNLLKKGGHSEVDLLQFCKGSGVEMENLLVIVRNEDIFLHIHKVPSLLHLKRCPNVTFAGVDSPEDPLEHTYQELFHSGGFVVSDDNVLEGMTVGELKDVIKTLEKLNSHGRWKWFLHYRESKKLKEDARGDLAANTKESVLKSCQVANMTEVLHYHKCDSKSCTRFERFNCLLNLQIQHITKRFAVFLTENASANWEALEDKGIFSLNISNFIATAQGLVAPFGSGFW